MHYFIAYELHRQWLAQFEREAELRRHLPRREHRSKAFGMRLLRSRRGAPLVARRAAGARPCH